MTSLEDTALAGAHHEAISLAEAAEKLGVHYMTAYRYVRTGRMVAEKRSGQWWVTADDLAAVVAEGTGPRRRPTSDGTTREMLVEPFTARLTAGDTAGCWDLISDALSAGASAAQVHRLLLQPALEQVGAQWARGDLSVASEHRATATANRLVGQMGPLFRRPGRRRGTIVIGVTVGDPHSLPTAMLADLLSDLRFDVVDLGANTPTESFVEICNEIDDLVGVGLCVVLDARVESAVEQANEIRAALPETFLLLGGTALIRATVKVSNGLVDAVSTTAAEACEAFDKVVASA